MAAIVIPVDDVAEGNANAKVRWRIAMQEGLRKRLDKADLVDALVNKIRHLKVSARARVEHPFRVIKREFRYVQVGYRRLKKNMA